MSLLVLDGGWSAVGWGILYGMSAAVIPVGIVAYLEWRKMCVPSSRAISGKERENRELAEGNRTLAHEIASQRKALHASNDRLIHSVKEKEALLLEVHNRVRSNMQVIDSLMGLIDTEGLEPVIHHRLQASRNRIRSMTYIHELLYQSGEYSDIDFGQFGYLQSDLLWADCQRTGDQCYPARFSRAVWGGDTDRAA